MSNNISTIGQLIDNNARLRDIRTQLNTLQIQLASGKKTNVFAGLGSQAVAQQRTRTDLNQIDVYQSNITTGQAHVRQILQVVSEFKEQAENVADFMATEQQKGNGINLTGIRDFAETTGNYLRKLLNSKDGDRYLLAGSDAFVEPLDDTGAHGTYMTSLVEDWKNGTIDTDTLISSYKSTPETTIGYSPALSSGQARGIFVRADVNTDVEYTLFANSDGFKDIVNAMTLIQKLDLDKVALEDGDNPASTETAPGAGAEEQKNNFYQMYEDAIKTINAGLNKLVAEEQRLQRADLLLGNITEDHTTDKFALESTLGQIEDVDPTDIAVKINALQIQLTAAYQVTANLGNLSLSNFI